MKHQALIKMFAVAIVLSLAMPSFAQMQMPSSGQKPLSPPAQAKVDLDGRVVTIDYSAPSMRGRKIMGDLLPYGKVWRTGANSSTTLKTSVPIHIGDLAVPEIGR